MEMSPRCPLLATKMNANTLLRASLPLVMLLSLPSHHPESCLPRAECFGEDGTTYANGQTVDTIATSCVNSTHYAGTVVTCVGSDNSGVVEGTDTTSTIVSTQGEFGCPIWTPFCVLSDGTAQCSSTPASADSGSGGATGSQTDQTNQTSEETSAPETTYTCTTNPPSDVTCPYECVGLEECEQCNCATNESGGGPWGAAMDVIMCLLPIVFLLVVTLIPKPLPTTVSLPLAALFMFLVRLMYLGSDPLLTCGSVVSGLHEALTPLSIMAGAIMLFESMEATNCMPYMMREMKALTNGHTVAELLMIFCFAYMVEGASGFGTPVALGAPMLVSLGHEKFDCVVTLLLMNTFATVWGAAGTPIWFGFGNIEGLTDESFTEISYKAGVALAVAAYLLLPLVLMLLVSFQQLKSNVFFVLCAISSAVIPSLGLSFVSYEFPALLGGLIGCGLTTLLIKCKVGLAPVKMEKCEETGRHPMDIGTVSENSFVASFIRSSSNLQNMETMALTASAVDGDINKDSATRVKFGANGTIPEEQDDDNEKGGASHKNVEHSMESGTAPNTPENSNGDISNKDFGQEGARTQQGQAVRPEEHHEVEPSIESFSSGRNDDQEKSESKKISESHRAVQSILGPRKEGWAYYGELIMRTFPIWCTVVLLIVTRIPQIGLKQQLTRTEPRFSIYFGTYGIFSCSAALVLMLENILTYPQLNWKYELLYVPFLVPFVLVSFLTIGIYRKQLNVPVKVLIKTVAGRLANPAVALMGALVLVQLMINGDEASPAFLIGNTLAKAFKGGWIAIAALIGVLGSFFSGSTTISNLTFGGIQSIAAERIGVNETAMLALQAAGASAGNGVCLNNIISACTVVGLQIGEGKVIGRTWKYVFAFAVIATLIMLIFLFQ